jgi:hypothetical protein
MGRLVLDQTQSDQVHGARFPVEVCDSAGVVLGKFVPAGVYREWIEDPEFFEPIDEATRQEALRDLAAGRLRTTADLLAEFERIRQTPRNRP